MLNQENSGKRSIVGEAYFCNILENLALAEKIAQVADALELPHHSTEERNALEATYRELSQEASNVTVARGLRGISGGQKIYEQHRGELKKALEVLTTINLRLVEHFSGANKSKAVYPNLPVSTADISRLRLFKSVLANIDSWLNDRQGLMKPKGTAMDLAADLVLHNKEYIGVLNEWLKQIGLTQIR